MPAGEERRQCQTEGGVVCVSVKESGRGCVGQRESNGLGWRGVTTCPRQTDVSAHLALQHWSAYFAERLNY